MKIFDTKWKRQWEQYRNKIEEMGYDKWIKSPIDLVDAIYSAERLKALSREAEVYQVPKASWKK